MHIAFAITQSLYSPAGTGRVLPLARRLVEQGHTVSIVALHHNWQGERQRIPISGVSVYYVGQMHVRKVGDSTQYFGPLLLLWIVAAGTLGMARALWRLRPDVIHVCKPHPQNSLAGLLVARLRRSVLLVVDEDDLEAESNATSGKWQVRLLRWLERTMPRLADGVTTHSAFLYQMLLDLGVPAKRILRVPNAVDTARFASPSPEDVQAWQSRLGIGAALPVVLYVGTLSLANHPVDLLIAAFALVAARVPHAVLVIAGGGKDLERLRAQARALGIEPRCQFAGRVEPQEVPALYALATCTADPVADDRVAQARWPIKIVESMAAGVPVVTGAVGDRSEMLGDGAAGILVAPGDARALASGLCLCLAVPESASALGAAGQRLALRYEAATVAGALADWYQALQPGREPHAGG